MDNLPDIQSDAATESSSKSEEDDPIDPRVQIELERLNHANEAINHLELQLEDARKSLTDFENTTEIELAQLEKRIGTSVSQAKSYYDARIKFQDAKETLTKTKHRFERAQALHVAAKELAIVSADHIDAAEKSNDNDTTWNETYRHAMEKAATAEREKYQADFDQQSVEKFYREIEQLVEKLQKDSRRSINKSKPYYEMKAEYYKELDFQKRKVYGLENCVNEAKSQYQQSLRNLEHISNEIHAQRNKGKRPNELTSNVTEEQLTPTEKKPISVISNQLRRESQPFVGFAATNDKYIPENSYNDQFILCSKPIGLQNSDKTDIRERVLSFSSQTTDEDDDKTTTSLHVLSDEQVDHLASVYNPYHSEFSSQTSTHKKLFDQSNNILSESFLY